MINPIITNNLPQIKDICQKHHVKELYVFGSATTDKFNEDSDVDFLYTMKEIPIETYADDFFEMQISFEKLLGRKVDLVPQKYLRNRIFIEEVNNTKQLLYAA